MRVSLTIGVLALLTTSAASAPPALTRYVGKYPHDKVAGVTFVRHPAVRRAVRSAVFEPAVTSEVLSEGVAIPIVRQRSMIVAHACRPHECDTVNWAIAVLTPGTRAAVCYHNSDLMGDESRWFVGGSARLRTPGGCDTEVPAQVVAAVFTTR